MFTINPVNNNKNEIIVETIWGLGESTLRAAFNNNDKRFMDEDYRKSGKVWLVKRSAMYRIYGEIEKDH